MGGVGKTTLALKLADEFKPSYPDAQIYLDLKGVDSQPLTPARAMAHTICSLHPEARIPEIDSELVALYRSVLDGKRVLLLMDNAAKREQVEPLMPPSTSLLLVTSRFHFYLPGLIPKDLNELPEQDAIDLLLKIAHRIGSAAAEIARLTGRLPLALRLAGSALAERLDLSPSDYIRRLIEKKETLGPVEASLKTSYDLLGEEQRRLWRLLSVFPESFDSQAAAAVWNLEMDEAREHIGEFVRSSLVEWEDSEGRYRLHDLARDFARRQMMANERCEGDRRHAEYFLKILHSANLLYSSGGQESFLGLSLFDREWGNIRAGQAWAASRFQECKEEAVTCSSYPAAGSFCLPIRQHLKDRICWLEAAVEAARYQRDRRSEAAHLGNLVLAYLAIGNYRQTIELSTQLLKIAREVQDRQFEGGALGNLGLAYNALGDVQQAARFFEQHLHITREMSDSRGESNALVNLGLTHAALGDFRTAISFYEKVIAISRKIGSLEQEGGAIGNLGIAYAALGDHQRAINYFERHRDIAKQLGDRRGEGTALGNLGTSYIALDDFDHALEHFRQHLAIGIEIGDRAGESYALGNLANIYAVLGDRESALKLCKQRLAMAREMGDRLGEGIAGWNLGIVFEEEGELDSAVDSMEIYVDYLGGIGHSDAEKYAARLKALRARIAEQKSLTPTPVPPPAPPSASAPSSPDPALPSTRPSKA
jgi:tetratricopeptide (TPR) repeat protein